MAQQDATVAVAGEGTVENRNKTKGKVYSLYRSVISTKSQDELVGSPSTAAITTLSMAVSVAVVILDGIRIGTTRKRSHRLYVDLPLFCIGFLGQSSEPTLEIVAAPSWVTWLTFIILAKKGQLNSEYPKQGARSSQGRTF
jgi:hypothetical protein